MDDTPTTRIPDVLERHEQQILDAWLGEQVASTRRRADLMRQAELRQQSTEFLRLVRAAAQSGNLTDAAEPEWAPVRDMLASLSRSRVIQGFAPREIATFVFSLK